MDINLHFTAIKDTSVDTPDMVFSLAGINTIGAVITISAVDENISEATMGTSEVDKYIFVAAIREGEEVIGTVIIIDVHYS